MSDFNSVFACGTSAHFNRRTLLKAAGVAGISWLTPLATHLARAAEKAPRGTKARSVIILWLQGGPSQLETFDPHPGTKIAEGSQAIETNAPGIKLNDAFQQLAEQMDRVSLVRSVMSKEGDHERATYNVKTGFRPDPTLVHPSLGAVVCHQLPNETVEIPRHVSILPGQWPARGGYLGEAYDAFKINDPIQPIPDMTRRVADERFERRIADLSVVETAFARGRLQKIEGGKTLNGLSTQAALRMMSSDQIKAFDVKLAPQELRDRYGDSPFGRGCLTAVRLIETGVRCVEITLNGWDSHVNNHAIQRGLVETLDPAFAALIRDLKERELLDSTVVMCGGEFGRTPKMNGAGGRDHWPHGFSIALAGGGIRGGHVVGETSPEPKMEKDKYDRDVQNRWNVEDVHATVLDALGINFKKELETPVGRPMAISKGKVIDELLAKNA